MIEDEAIGITLWSAVSSEKYDRSKVLAADMNKDGMVRTIDAECLTEVTLFLAEIDQQTGDIISY